MTITSLVIEMMTGLLYWMLLLNERFIMDKADSWFAERS